VSAARPQELELPPGAQRIVTVEITAQDGFTGEKTFNVNAFDECALIGGVTLKVHS